MILSEINVIIIMKTVSTTIRQAIGPSADLIPLLVKIGHCSRRKSAIILLSAIDFYPYIIFNCVFDFSLMHSDDLNMTYR